MHPSIQQRVDGVKALQVRSSIATAAFYALIGRDAPAQAVRYQVTTKGPKAYHIIELSTGKVKGFRFSWKDAVNFAQQLEAKADGVVVVLSEGAQQ